MNSDIITNFLESKIHFNLINKGYVLYNFNIPISDLENICKKLKENDYSVLKVRYGSKFSIYCKKVYCHKSIRKSY